MLLLLLALFAVACGAPAQTTTGVVHGSVFDQSGGVLQRAHITARDLARGTVRETDADERGEYRLAGLPPGRYEVKASASNFHPMAAAVSVGADTRTLQNFTLPVSSASYDFNVVATEKTIETESPTLGYTLDRDRIASLPLNRRDFLQLSLLVPGALPPVQDSELSSRGSFAMHAGGAREEFNNFTLDGADNNDPYTNRYVLQPSVESIGEFRILTNNYSAEYGRSAGAQVNVVTRSGGNQLHGAAYNYLRNRVLDARNFFDGARRPAYTRNQFGASLGGAVRRDRAFFFANYEGLTERRVFSRLAVTPNDAERSGDLSGLARAVSDPFTQRPFPGNRIPTSRIHPLAPRVLDLFRLSARPQLTDGNHNVVARYDHNLGARDSLTLRYGWGLQDLLEPFAEESTDVPGFGNYVDNSGHNVAAQHQRVWSARTIQTTRAAWNHGFRRARAQNYATNVGTAWGVNWLTVRERDYGYPSIRIAGFSQVGDPDQLPLERTTDVAQIHEGFALQRGVHSLKLGGEFRRIKTDGYLDYFGRGSLTFSGALTGAGIGDVLLGLPSFGIQSTFDNRQALRTRAYNLFAQDDWRVTPHLTLNFGMRYEYNTPPVDPEDRMYIYDPGSARLRQVGRDGLSRSGLHADRNNFGPRVGFALAAWDGLTVRGGYGVFYDSGMFVVNSSLYFNPPLFNVRIFFPTATSLLTLNDPFPARGGVSPAPSPNTLSPSMTTGHLQQWNFSIDRQLSPATTATVSYAGSKGTHLIRSRDLNQPRPGAGAVAARRPNPAFGGFFFTESGANSNFHSLQANVDRRFARGVSAMVSYTWSKSIDDTSAFLGTKPDKNFPQDSYNYAAERAQSSFDMRHRLVSAWTWAWRGFEFRGILSAQSGQPFTPLLRFDNSNTGNTGGIFGNDRPNVVGNPRLSERTAQRWFDTRAFAVPRPFTFGNAGRNVVLGPGFVNVDAGLSRRIRLSERFALTLDAQAFNLTNTTHFDMPERYADESAAFGRILSAKAPRQVQFGLRLGF